MKAEHCIEHAQMSIHQAIGYLESVPDVPVRVGDLVAHILRELKFAEKDAEKARGFMPADPEPRGEIVEGVVKDGVLMPLE